MPTHSKTTGTKKQRDRPTPRAEKRKSADCDCGERDENDRSSYGARHAGAALLVV